MEARSAAGNVKFVDALTERRVLPQGFFDDYEQFRVAEGSPEAAKLRSAVSKGAGPSQLAASGAIAPMATYVSVSIMTGYVSKQEKDWYCGPAVMQMIEWADDNTKESQSYWVGSLGTTKDGTAISNIVSRINSETNWDDTNGAYSVVSVVGKNDAWFRNSHVTQFMFDHAPIVEHVKLLKSYFGYLNYDHGGHYQVGRGYNNYGDYIFIIEPYNERDFRSGGASSSGYRTVYYKDLWNATLANSNMNIGM